VTRAVTRTWYRIALGRPGEPPKLVAAEGEHLGVAIAAAEQHAPGSFAIAAEVATGSQIPLGESVGKDRVVALDEVPVATTFHWPSGVLPGLASPAVPVRRGYVIHPDPAMLVIEAQTDAEHLTDLYLGLIERLPSADNLEVRVLDHFEDAGKTEVWLTSRVDARRILRFLDDHDVEVLGNGHLELSVYVRKHNATLRLTEHKTVVWLAEPAALETEVTAWLKELSVPRIDPLVTVTAVPHFHYRPPKSRDRKKLNEQLYRQRLRRVATVARETAG
jgi:hypothetical protein